jgi:hypothetical protein
MDMRIKRSHIGRGTAASNGGENSGFGLPHNIVFIVGK